MKDLKRKIIIIIEKYWIIKSLILATLSPFRSEKGYTINYKDYLTQTQLQIKFRYERCIELIDLIRGQKKQIEGSVCFDLGTGWRPKYTLFIILNRSEKDCYSRYEPLVVIRICKGYLDPDKGMFRFDFGSM